MSNRGRNDHQPLCEPLCPPCGVMSRIDKRFVILRYLFELLFFLFRYFVNYSQTFLFFSGVLECFGIHWLLFCPRSHHLGFDPEHRRIGLCICHDQDVF